MRLHVLVVPFDSGRREWRMGRGPAWLLRHGLASGVRALGHDVEAEYVEFETDEEPLSVAGDSFALWRLVAPRARALAGDGALPVIRSGNCGATIGAVAGLARPGAVTDLVPDLGVVWFDAHGDFNTPDTTGSGFLDGMSLATLTGRCWRTLAGAVDGFAPVPDAHVLLVGVRDLDPAEEIALEESELGVVRGAALEQVGVDDALGLALDVLAARVRRVHLHLDLDVLDARLVRAVRLVATRLAIAGITISAFDPDAGEGAKLVPIVGDVLDAVLAATPGPPRMNDGTRSTDRVPSFRFTSVRRRAGARDVRCDRSQRIGLIGKRAPPPIPPMPPLRGM